MQFSELIDSVAWQTQQGPRLFVSLCPIIHSAGFQIRLVVMWQQQFSASHPDTSPSRRGKEAIYRELTEVTTRGERYSFSSQAYSGAGGEISFPQARGHMGNKEKVSAIGVLFKKGGGGCVDKHDHYTNHLRA